MEKSKEQPPPKEKILSEIFIARLKSENKFQNIEISGEVFIDSLQGKTLNLVKCKFDSLSINIPLNSLSLDHCEYELLKINEGIKNLQIFNTNYKSARITAEKCNIETFTLTDNENISEIEIGILKNLDIQSFKCFNSKIKTLNLLLNSKYVHFNAGNEIEWLSLQGDLSAISFDIPQHKLAKYSLSNYKQVDINANDNKGIARCTVNGGSFDQLTFRFCNQPLEIDIANIECNIFRIDRCTLGEKGRISISECDNISNIIFKKSSINALNIFNSNLKNTTFLAFQSILKEINWQFVDWPQSVNNYFRSEYDEAYTIETLRILKLNSYLQHDKYNGLIFSSLENEAYRKKILKEKQSITDQTILWLNKISNNHGLNPIRGVLFTLTVGLLFFIPNLFLLQNSFWEWGWDGFASFFKVTGITTELYIKFIYAAHSFDYMKEFNPRGFTFVLDILGRIFIAYGYYQTISAFRKFNKK